MTSPIGTNITDPRDWRPWFTTDVMKQSRDWLSGVVNGAFSDGRAVPVDRNGWVTSVQSNQIVRTLFGWATNLRPPTGRYVVTYKGQGTLIYGGNAVKVVGDSTPGRDVVQVTETTTPNGFNASWWLGITATDPLNYIRDIVVSLPGVGAENITDVYPVDASIEAELAGYSTIRYMQSGLIDDNPPATWASRAHISDARWTVKGMPIERMVQMSNLTHTDAWFCVPHLADDDYVRNMASLISSTLDPSLKCYVEYSNEVWNPDYAQTGYCRTQGLALNFGRNTPTSAPDPNLAMLQYYAMRANQVFDIFSQVWATRSQPQLVRVIAAQAANSWSSGRILSAVVPFRADALAIAPYIDTLAFHRTQAEVNAARVLTPDQYIDQYVLARAMPRCIAAMNAQWVVSQRYGIPLIAYEGGQSFLAPPLAATDTTMQALLIAVTRHPRMYDVYRQYFDAWRAAGGQLFMHFVHCVKPGDGGFGAKEHPLQPIAEAHKYRAICDWSAANPKWW